MRTVSLLLSIVIVVMSTSFTQVKPKTSKFKKDTSVDVLHYKLHKVEDELNLLYRRKGTSSNKRITQLTDSVKVLKKELRKLGVEVK